MLCVMCVVRAMPIPERYNLGYNIGVGGFGRSSVRRLTNAGDYTGAARAFGLWNKAGGRVLPGLTRRRAEERAMYEEGIR